MDAMNSFNRTPTTRVELPPTLRVPPAEPATDESWQSECCCPELCQLDHGN